MIDWFHFAIDQSDPSDKYTSPILGRRKPGQNERKRNYVFLFDLLCRIVKICLSLVTFIPFFVICPIKSVNIVIFKTCHACCVTSRVPSLSAY